MHKMGHKDNKILGLKYAKIIIAVLVILIILISTLHWIHLNFFPEYIF